MLHPRQFLISALVLGAALWLSRAVVDVAGAGVRVAYLPSAPELLGLAVLGGLVLTLIQAIVEHSVARSRPGAHLSSDAVTPLLALTLLALPYLPWLADRVPLVTALAGPLGLWLWTIVIAVSVWALATGLPPRARQRAWHRDSWWVAMATALILVLAAWRLAPGAPPDSLGARVLVAPVLALGGDRGASLTMVVLGASVGTLLWRWLRALTGSTAAATFGWLAIATCAPFVLHGGAVSAEIPAALAVLVALSSSLSTADTRATSIVRGLALGALPWLGAKYVPMAMVIGVLLAVRAPKDRARRAAMAASAALLAVAWLAWLFGTQSPTALYGSLRQMTPGHLVAGLPGLFFDQQYGVVTVAPLLAMASIGWWRLWRRDAMGRILVGETALPLLALAVTVGANTMWWGGSAAPGRQLIAALPLLGVPLAVVWLELADAPARRALLVVLLGVGIATAGTLVFAHEGRLVANNRDGVAGLLAYLAPADALSRIAPSFTANRAALAWPLVLLLGWVGVVAALWWAADRAKALMPGRAGLAAIAACAVAVFTVSAMVPASSAGAARTGASPTTRAQSAALDAYDANARPVAIVFDPWRVVPPATVPPMVEFLATPGERRAPQPLRVLLNMRLALPTGTYRVVLEPLAGQSLHGAVGLQVGRAGAPQQTWTVDVPVGASWTQTFSLDLDANFVGLRTAESFEASVGRMLITPVRIVDVNRRLHRPSVLATALFAGLPAYFHDSNADVEASGFWARARVTTAMTLVVNPAGQPRGVRLRLHSGEGTTVVRLATPAWSTRVSLTPGHLQLLLVPALDRQRLLPLEITPEGGFIPAQHGGAPRDRRLLGCWVEVVP